MAETKHPYLDQYNQPLNFILQIPTDVQAFETVPSLLQKGLIGITNISKGIVSDISEETVSSNVDNFIYLPKMPYSAARINFDFSADNNYKEIINISQLIPGTDNALFNYAMLNNGESIGNAIKEGVSAVLGVEGTTEQVYDQLQSEDVAGFVKGMFYSLGIFAAEGAKAAGNLANKGTDVLRRIATGVGADTSVVFDNIGKSGQSAQSVNDALVSGQEGSELGLKNFNAFLSPKLWGGTSNPYPEIKLNISYVCEKNTDRMVDLLNWVQEIASPLTLLLPVIPLKLSIYNLQRENLQKDIESDLQSAFGENGDYSAFAGNLSDTATSMSSSTGENLGIRPITYTQQNYGYFNLTGVTITDLDMGYANNPDSKFYNNSGIPLPIGVEVSLTLEAFDPFFYQMYTPNSVFDAE